MRASLAAYDIGKDFQPANTPRTVDMRSLGAELNALLPEQKNIVYDAGNLTQPANYSGTISHP